MHNPREKRRNRRTNQTRVVTLESLDIGIDENSRMINCSESGLHVETDRVLQPGSDVFIRIKDFSHNQSESYKCHHAKVIWGKRLTNASFTYCYGVKYIVPSKKKNSPNHDPVRRAELRKYPRIKCSRPAIMDLGDRTYNCVISDISRNGCFVESREPLNIRQVFDLVIPGSKFSNKNILRVEVARLSPIGVGVRYKGVLKKDASP
ncbi:MAG: PilZ domain-containing protein [Desulfobacterales bacterium]|nr:PilZ domain-containing protein [Desulfobacterales bacterium]